MYIAVLATCSFLLLLIGGLTRPRNQQTEAAPASVADILQLERVTQRRQVEHIADYFASVAATVEDSVVLLGATGHSGVVWQGGEGGDIVRAGTVSHAGQNGAGQQGSRSQDGAVGSPPAVRPAGCPARRRRQRPPAGAPLRARSMAAGGLAVPRRGIAVRLRQPVRRHRRSLRGDRSAGGPDQSRPELDAAGLRRLLAGRGPAGHRPRLLGASDRRRSRRAGGEGALGAERPGPPCGTLRNDGRRRDGSGAGILRARDRSAGPSHMVGIQGPRGRPVAGRPDPVPGWHAD